MEKTAWLENMSNSKKDVGAKKKGLRSYKPRLDHSSVTAKSGSQGAGRTMRRSGSSRSSSAQPIKGRVIPQKVWEKFSDDQLLDTRICDLGLRIEKDGFLATRIEKLYLELENMGLQFRPHVWLSDEWFSPDGIPGIAIPFCLAHPRLRSLERQMMMEVEGGTSQWCMRILRHEAGHAIDTAWRLNRRQSYKNIFGNYNAPYPDSYRPKPNSKRFVMHLEPWYAQSHPSEDFAETFAVWLTPRSPWKIQYAGWPALEKLEYMERLMESIAESPARVRSRTYVDSVSRMSQTLREHYDDRQSRYCTKQPDVFDHDIRRLFPRKAKSRAARYSAAGFLQRNRAELVRVVCQWTGEYRYSVHQVIRQMIDRCREMDLQITDDEHEALQKTIVLVTVHTMNYLHGGFPRVAL